jgi:hypothetical protein
MKKLLLTLPVVLMTLGLALAEPTPTVTPSPTWVPQKFTPKDLPPAVQATVQPEPSRKPSPWMSLTGLGIGLPAAHLGNAYGTAFEAELGSGLKISHSFSIWLDVNLGFFGSRNDTLTGGNNYTMIEAAFWGRYRFLSGDFSPYLFAGPGVAYNENRSNGSAQYDPNTGVAYIPINAFEVDFLVEGGLGFDLALGEGLDLFLQGKLTYDFSSSNFAAYAATDSPILVVPVETGILFGL